jgi:hypothetical protein
MNTDLIACGNAVLEDKFRCPFDPAHKQCKNIPWYDCRNYQQEKNHQDD